jgi:hypothetical protein
MFHFQQYFSYIMAVSLIDTIFQLYLSIMAVSLIEKTKVPQGKRPLRSTGVALSIAVGLLEVINIKLQWWS